MNEHLVPWLIASGGWLVAILSLVLPYFERRRAREEDRLGKTLDYFDGGSQRRSIGIALIEGLWVKNTRYHNVIVPLVANQIVYLLLSTASRDAHNERNLVRLIMILKSIPALRKSYPERYYDVCDAIERKIAGEKKGIEIPEDTLKEWSKLMGDDG